MDALLRKGGNREDFIYQRYLQNPCGSPSSDFGRVRSEEVVATGGGGRSLGKVDSGTFK